MGLKPLEPPSFFTQDWYDEQKKLGKPDSIIMRELYTSDKVFYRWKCQLGIHINVNLRKRNSSNIPKLEGKEEIVKNLYLAGATYVVIAKKLHVSKETVRKEINKLGIRRNLYHESVR